MTPQLPTIDRTGLPAMLLPDQAAFDALWGLRPAKASTVMMHGRTCQVPRRDRSYLSSYRFSGTTSECWPLPVEFEPVCRWLSDHVAVRFNNIFVNWYEGPDYMGAHSDAGLCPLHRAPVVIASLGGTRILRFRRRGEPGFADTLVDHGDVVVIPYDVNETHTHEIPRRVAMQHRRISITCRVLASGC